MNNKEYDAAIEQLKKVSKVTTDFIEGLSGSSETLDKKNSSVLFGSVGAFIGTLLGSGLDLLIPMMDIIHQMVITGSLTGLGATIALLAYRGKQIKVEKALKSYDMLHDSILSHLKELPEDAPSELRMLYYQQLYELNDAFKQSAFGFLIKDKNYSPPMLPSKKDERENNKEEDS